MTTNPFFSVLRDAFKGFRAGVQETADMAVSAVEGAASAARHSTRNIAHVAPPVPSSKESARNSSTR